ncbi:MAG: uracil-DNA glycosylase [Gemmobacter sp.]
MADRAPPDLPPAPPDGWSDLPFFTAHWPALWTRLQTAPAWQPAPDHLFRALHLTPPTSVRAVILGQDPYPTPGRATGLAFAFPRAERPLDSLRNILRELDDDLGIHRAHGDLSGWAGQGVLLLNTVLSVPVGQSDGHRGWGWERLTAQVLARVAAARPTAFVLWGSKAQAAIQPDPARHLVLKAPHPSPLSAHRGFFGSRPFSAINAWAAARGDPPIDWSA